MKNITAIINPHRIDHVREALAAAGVKGLTVTEVKGYGRQQGHTELYRGTEYQTNFLPKLYVEIVVVDEAVARISEAIINSARSGQIGDGKLIITEVEKVIRIRTNELNDEAL